MIEIKVDAKNRKNAGRMASAIPQSSITGNVVMARYGKPGSEPALAAFLRKGGSTPLTEGMECRRAGDQQCERHNDKWYE